MDPGTTNLKFPITNHQSPITIQVGSFKGFASQSTQSSFLPLSTLPTKMREGCIVVSYKKKQGDQFDQYQSMYSRYCTKVKTNGEDFQESTVMHSYSE